MYNISVRPFSHSKSYLWKQLPEHALRSPKVYMTYNDGAPHPIHLDIGNISEGYSFHEEAMKAAHLFPVLSSEERMNTAKNFIYCRVRAGRDTEGVWEYPIPALEPDELIRFLSRFHRQLSALKGLPGNQNWFHLELCTKRARKSYADQHHMTETPKYHAVSPLFSNPKELLSCLAPFTSVISMRGMNRYMEQLRGQMALTHLPFDCWSEMVQDAIQREWLSVHPRTPVFFKVDTAFPSFLNTRFHLSEQKEKQEAVETAFRKYYDKLACAIYKFSETNGMNKKEVMQTLVRPEYENLNTALNLAMKANASVTNIYRILFSYLNLTQQHEQTLELGKRVLKGLEGYPEEKLRGQFGAEFVLITDHIARYLLSEGKYADAENAYQKALAVWLENTYYRADQIRQKSGAIYHQLGRAAQEQQQWDVAKEYLLRDLKIANEYKDRKGVQITLNTLFRLWKASGDQELPNTVAAILK